jgi:hypothetical protein
MFRTRISCHDVHYKNLQIMDDSFHTIQASSKRYIAQVTSYET